MQEEIPASEGKRRPDPGGRQRLPNLVEEIKSRHGGQLGVLQEHTLPGTGGAKEELEAGQMAGGAEAELEAGSQKMVSHCIFKK